MAWIREIEPRDAGGDLSSVYEKITGARGKLSNIMKVQSLSPGAMAAHMDLYLAVMFGKADLSREEREMVAVVVSVANRCDYCVHHHAAALGAYWRDEERLKAFVRDFRAVELPERMRRALDYADALTRDPSSVDEAKVAALRDAGLEDEGILTLNLVTAYFNFVNRIAEGLGVEFTEEEVSGYRY